MQSRIIFFSAVFVGIVGAIFFGNAVAGGNYKLLGILFSAYLCVLWVCVAREFWWIFLPAAAMLPGTFQFLFKIYPHEVALFIGILAALPMVVFRRNQNSIPPPMPILCLFVYLCCHCIGSVLLSNANGLFEIGNILRGYMWGLWPIIFSILFFLVGSKVGIKGAFRIAVGFSSVQLIAVLISSFYGVAVIIPGLNFTLSDPRDNSSYEFTIFSFRWNAVYMVALNLCAISYFKTKMRFFSWFLLPFTFSILLFGGGRAAIATGVLYFAIWMVLTKKIGVLLVSLLPIITLIIFINFNTRILNILPHNIERALGGFVLDKKYLEYHFGGGVGSNDWHNYLKEIAYSRWSETPISLLFGYGIKPHEKLTTAYTPEEIMYRYALSAANTGAYEKTLWTILAVTGLIGIFLYIWVFVFYLKRFLFYLRYSNNKDRASMTLILLATTSLIVTVFTCFIAGGFVGLPLVFSAIAYKILVDSENNGLQIK